MTVSAPRYVSLIENYDRLIVDLAHQYGASSQAVVFAKYEFLVTLFDLVHRDRDAPARIRERLAALVLDLQRLYAIGEPMSDLPDWCRVIQSDPLLVEFDRDYYAARYAATAESIRPDVLVARPDILSELRPLSPYMYVVDEERQLRLYAKPFDLRRLVFGRNITLGLGSAVTHAMLVPDSLRARAAGEIVFFGETHVVAVIANTKSGHFRPPPESATLLRELACSTFGIDAADVLVFALFAAKGGGRE